MSFDKEYCLGTCFPQIWFKGAGCPFLFFLSKLAVKKIERKLGWFKIFIKKRNITSSVDNNIFDRIYIELKDAEKTRITGGEHMDYSTKISERMWNQPDKGELEAERENTFIDDIVQKAHIEKELLSNLDGIETVFDGGAGCGRFSILLAKQGLKVTHFDISVSMIEKAKEIAAKEGVLDRITFVQGALEDLSAYADNSFDLVMSFDSPISYTYPNQEKTISELVRIARKRIMISVSSRLGALPYVANPIQKNQFILDKNSKDGWVQWCLSSREQMIEEFSFSKESIMKTYETGLFGDIEESKKAYDRGEAPWSISYHFMPDELKGILEKNGVKNIELAGPGAFARTIPNEILVKIMNDKEQRRDFLEFCHMYDSNPYVCGMGKDNLFAKGEI